MNIGKIKQSNFFRFLYGEGTPTSNKLLGFSIPILIIYFSVSVSVYYLIGYVINFMNKSLIDYVHLISTIFLIFGFVSFFMEFLSSYLFNFFSEIINDRYKENYYSMVLNQDMFWYKQSDLNEISQGIKKDLQNIEAGVK